MSEMKYLAAPTAGAVTDGIDWKASSTGAWLYRRVLLIACAVTAIACVVIAGRTGAPTPPAASATGHRAATARAAVPLAAEGVISRTLGRAEPAYRATHAGGADVVLRNPAQHLRARLHAGAIVVRSGRLSVGMRPLGPAASAPRIAVNRVGYHLGAVREWYANGPLGIEQGFTIRSAPAAQRSLVVSLGISGNARVALSHGVVTFRGPGATRLTERGLSAVDATGHRLPASFALSGGRLRIRVDVARAAFPVRIDPLIQQAELTEGASEDGFGDAMAVDGGTVVVGAAGATVGSNANEGAVFVFTEPSSGWVNAQPTAELTAADGAQNDSFGFSVAISGQTIVAGSFYADADHGAAYVYQEPSGGWTNATQTAKLTSTDGAQAFGHSVAISGQTIAVGSPYATVRGTQYLGAVDVFTEPGGGWTDATQTATLTASDGAEGDLLGWSVGMSGQTIVAGALEATATSGGSVNGPGAAYVFTEPTDGWADETQAARLDSSDGAAGDMFGNAVAIAGSTIAVGAPAATVAGNANAGATYVFSEPGSGWANANETAKLTAADEGAGDMFGLAVAASDGTVVAGSHGADDRAGAADVFTEPAGGWTSDAADERLVNPDQTGIFFGYAVGISDSTVVVTEPDGGPSEAVGGAYVFNTGTSAPVFTSTNSATALQGEPFSFRVATNGAPPATISESGPLPAGIGLSQDSDGSAILGGTPQSGSSGTYPISLTASNGDGQDATQSFTLTVSSATSAPVITSRSDNGTDAGQAFSFTVTTTGYPTPKLSKTGALPKGFTFTDNGNGQATIAGTAPAAAAGAYPITIIARNSAGSTSQAFTFSVYQAPTLKAIPNQTITAGQPYSYTVTTKSTYPTPTFYLNDSVSPNGLTLTDNGNGTATLSGPVISPGTYSITVVASNFLGQPSQQFTLTVDAPPQFQSGSTATATIRTPFSYTVSVYAYPAAKVTESGPLPKGITFSSANRAFSGTAKTGTAGTYPVTLTAKSGPNTTTQSFTLTVQ